MAIDPEIKNFERRSNPLTPVFRTRVFRRGLGERPPHRFTRRSLYQLHQEDLGLFALLMMNLARELAWRLQFMDRLLLESVHRTNRE